MRAHAEVLELADQVLLPVERVGDLVLELVAISGARVFDQESLRAAGSQALDDPEDARHRRSCVPAVGASSAEVDSSM